MIVRNITAAVIVALTLSLSACGGVLSEGGLDGKYVNDALPKDATIYKAEIDKAGKTEVVPGTEDTEATNIIWNTYNPDVPCSAIKGVDYWDNSWEGIDLVLARCQNGCKYFPRPEDAGRYWPRTYMLLGELSFSEAEKLAEYCAVPLQVRN